MKHHYLAKLLFLLLFAGFGFPSGAYAQTGSVSGRITDSKNEGIPGATVLIEGTTLGSSSNVDGTYNIQSVPAGPHTLIVSFVGYNSVRRPVTVVAGQNTEASTSLSENTTQLSEAVVVGYGTQRRQDVTGAIATVDSRQFVKGQVTNPEQLIQGKIAGVSITSNSGQPGVGSTIRIRGGSSINASNDPLIVIDGVPVSREGVNGAANALSLINPNDIESYSVLKDASATAIYGSRAANGVILITTKKGISGDKTHVNFNTLFSVSQRAKKLKVLTGDEYRALIRSQNFRTAVGDATPLGTPSRDTLLGTANTDWQDEIYRTAYTFDNNISLTGSAGKMPYRVSYGNLNQQGIIRTSELQRNTVSVGITPVLFGDRLRIDVNLKGSQAKNRFADAGVVYGAAAFNPTVPVRSSDPLFAPYGGYYETLQASSGIPEANAPANPVSLLDSRQDRSTVYRSIGNVQFDLKVPGIEGLRANYNVGYDFQRGTGTIVVAPRSRAGFRSLTNDSLNGTNTPYSQNRNSWLNEVYLKYARDFGNFGRFDVLAGYSYQNFYNFNPNNLSTYANGVSLPATTGAATPYSSGESALQSFYGRINYVFEDRYLLTATFRRDGSSVFSPSNRYGNFPALGVGWRLKDESFLHDVAFVSELKLRLGYGITGQQDINSVYGYLPRFQLGSANTSYQFGYNPDGTPKFVQTLRPESFIAGRRWEETTTYNGGIDYGFGTSGRVTGSVDVYYKRSDHLLFNGPIAAGAGLTNNDVYNIGAFETKGIEFAVNTQVVRTEKLNWNLNFNATYNKRNILNLNRPGIPGSDTLALPAGGAGFGNAQVYSQGYAPNVYFLYKQRYDAQGHPVVATSPTDVNAYEDINGDGKITARDFVHSYQPAPIMILGLTSNLTAGNAYFNFTLRSYLGNYNYNNVSAGLNSYNGVFSSNGNYFTNTTPLLGNELNFASQQPYSDYFVQKADFLRCENITLGYNFPKLGGSDGRNLGLTLSVQNAFVITSYKGIDPEVVGGIDNNAYPRARTYTLGLSLGF